MRCKRIQSLQLTPDSAQWSQAERRSVEMIPAPLDIQSTGLMHHRWAEKPYGRITKLEVAALHDGEMLALLLSWQVPEIRVGNFPHGAALAFPVASDFPLTLMGTTEAPINILHWQEGRAEVRSLIATGIGRTRPGPNLRRMAVANIDGKRIDLVLACALDSSAGLESLAVGKKIRVGFALWDGGNEECGGIKAFSIDWIDLALDA